MSVKGRPWPAVLFVSSIVLAAVILAGAPQPFRGVITLWFFLTCPGLAIVGLLQIEDLLAEALIAVALSVTIGMLLALVMVLTHTWSPAAGTAILILLSLAGAGAQVRR
jgi:hypothetical protein